MALDIGVRDAVRLRLSVMARHSEIYKSKEWASVRAHVISKANGLCEKCKAKGKIKKGKEVHHKVWLTDDNKTDWDITYNPNNLIYLCSDCHNDEHDRSIGIQQFIIPPG